MKIVAVVMLVLFLGCRKTDKLQESSQVEQSSIVQIKAWLSAQRQNATRSGSLWLDSLSNSINWNKAEQASFWGAEKLLVIPLQEISIQKRLPNGYLPLSTNIITNSLVVIQDEKGIIRLVNLVQMATDKSIDPTANTSLISKVYKNKERNFDGLFSILSISKNLVLELNYSAGKITQFKRLNGLDKTPSSDNSGSSYTSQDVKPLFLYGGNCIHFTLVITYYSADDVELYTLESPLGTYCDGDEDPYGLDRSPATGGTRVVRLVTVTSIKDSLSDTCLKRAKDRISSSQYKNFITTTFQSKYNGYGSQLDLIFKEDGTLTYNGSPIPAGSTHTENSWTVLLNPNFSHSISQELFGAAIAHEILHSFANSYYLTSGDPILSTEKGMHAFMMTNYTEDLIALLVQSFGLTPQNATALALTGYDDLWADASIASYMTSTFGISKADYLTISDNYSDGTQGSVCH